MPQCRRAQCLRLVQHLPTNMPSLAEVRRYLERAELLEPLRILTGTTGGWDGFAVEDRFVGRREELRELRAFVDELASEGVLESVTRGIGRVVRGVESVFDGRGVGVFVIEAGGGLGKSTLMAKFVLDHALKQSRPFPFAYFDFDRATLQPLEPRQLLLEAIRQVVLQFPAAGPEADKLCQQIRDDLARTKSGTGLFDPFADFRRLVSDRVTRGRRAFLLIFRYHGVGAVRSECARRCREVCRVPLPRWLSRAARGGGGPRRYPAIAERDRIPGRGYTSPPSSALGWGCARDGRPLGPAATWAGLEFDLEQPYRR